MVVGGGGGGGGDDGSDGDSGGDGDGDGSNGGSDGGWGIVVSHLTCICENKKQYILLGAT